MIRMMSFLVMWLLLVLFATVVEHKLRKKNSEEIQSEKTCGYKIKFSFIVNFFFVFTVLIFAPFEIFFMNSNDFGFSFRDFWWIIVGVAIVFLIVSVAICVLLNGIIFEYINFCIFTFTLCSYLQVMFLNGAMKSLTGERITWNNTILVGNLLIWVICLLFTWIAKIKFNNIWEKTVMFLSGALSVMQIVALCSLLLTSDITGEKKVGYLSKEGMFELSNSKNVVVFVLDFFDGRTMEDILDEDPDFIEPLKGFTYFPDATSVYSRTYPSVVYLLTGNKCYFDRAPREFINESYSSSTFLLDMYNNNVNLGLYTYSDYLGEDIREKVDNYVSINPELDMFQIEKNMIRMSLYRSMPYWIKEVIQYDVDTLNNLAIKIPEDPAKEKYQNFNDEWFAGELKKGINVEESEGAFRFYHLGSCHRNLSDPIPAGRYSFEIIFEYIKEMQEYGIYDDSTIIITTDHGSSGGGETLDMPHGTAVPIMFVKPAGATCKDTLQISKAPVSHTDLFATVLDGFCLESDEYAKSIFEINENDSRERYYYYTALYSDDDGEVELREYLIDGDARLPENYHFTGNKWEVFYSLNNVSGKD